MESAIEVQLNQQITSENPPAIFTLVSINNVHRVSITVDKEIVLKLKASASKQLYAKSQSAGAVSCFCRPLLEFTSPSEQQLVLYVGIEKIGQGKVAIQICDGSAQAAAIEIDFLVVIVPEVAQLQPDRLQNQFEAEQRYLAENQQQAQQLASQYNSAPPINLEFQPQFLQPQQAEQPMQQQFQQQYQAQQFQQPQQQQFLQAPIQQPSYSQPQQYAPQPIQQFTPQPYVQPTQFRYEAQPPTQSMAQTNPFQRSEPIYYTQVPEPVNQTQLLQDQLYQTNQQFHTLHSQTPQTYYGQGSTARTSESTVQVSKCMQSSNLVEPVDERTKFILPRPKPSSLHQSGVAVQPAVELKRDPLSQPAPVSQPQLPKPVQQPLTIYDQISRAAPAKKHSGPRLIRVLPADVLFDPATPEQPVRRSIRVRNVSATELRVKVAIHGRELHMDKLNVDGSGKAFRVLENMEFRLQRCAGEADIQAMDVIVEFRPKNGLVHAAKLVIDCGNGVFQVPLLGVFGVPFVVPELIDNTLQLKNEGSAAAFVKIGSRLEADGEGRGQGPHRFELDAVTLGVGETKRIGYSYMQCAIAQDEEAVIELRCGSDALRKIALGAEGHGEWKDLVKAATVKDDALRVMGRNIDVIRVRK